MNIEASIARDTTIKTTSSKRTRLIPWIICGLAAIYYCYEYFLRISPSVMKQEIMRVYDLTGAEFGSLNAFYYHAYVPMQIMVGLLMDRYGPRRLLTFACLLCVLGTVLFASSHEIALAQIGRLLIGLGSAFAFVGAMKVASIWLPPNRFALIAGIILCLGMSGAMCGDILLGAVVDALGWQITIYASAGVGVVLAFFIWFIVRDKNPGAHFAQEEQMSFHNVLTGMLNSLKNSQIWINGVIGCLLYLSLSVFAELWGVPYLQEARGFTKAHAATANSLVFLGWAIGGPLWGWFSDYIQLRKIPILFASIFALLLVCALLYIPNLSWWLTSIIMFLFGLFSSVQILVFAICREISPRKVVGTSIALTNMLVMCSGNFFPALVGEVLDKHWMGIMLEGARVYPPDAYHSALAVMPVAILVAIVLLFFLKETGVGSQ